MLRKLISSIVHKTVSASFTGATGAAAALWLSGEAAKLDPKAQQTIARGFVDQFVELLDRLRSAENLPECHDCSKFGYGYMLHDHVWESAVGSSVGPPPIVGETLRYLCLPGVELRLKRPVGGADLTGAPINDPLHYAWGSTPVDAKDGASS